MEYLGERGVGVPWRGGMSSLERGVRTPWRCESEYLGEGGRNNGVQGEGG